VAKQLLERDGDLARIQTLIESALAGDGRYLMIEGPAGIGKTRLIEAAAGRGVEAGMTVLAAGRRPMLTDLQSAPYRVC
jgi:predicted ATPase